MLSLFPNLLVFQGFAPLLLRLTLGIIFVFWAYRKIRNKKDKGPLSLALLHAVVGILLIIGLFTQAAALISLIIFAFGLIQKMKDRAFLTDGVNYYFILFIISFSLLLTGPGLFAFDLPL